MSRVLKTTAWVTLIAVALFAIACAGEQAEPEVIIKEVIKEVPVEVEKVVEVVKEVEVEKVVEVEVVKEVEVIATAVPEPDMSDEPVYGGTIRLGMIDQGTLDTMLAGLSQGSAPYGELAYDNITMYWFDGEITPWAVESWSSTEDLTQYTFKVRDGITFHSGAPLTSADIKVHPGPHQGGGLRFSAQGPDLLHRHHRHAGRQHRRAEPGRPQRLPTRRHDRIPRAHSPERDHQ